MTRKFCVLWGENSIQNRFILDEDRKGEVFVLSGFGIFFQSLSTSKNFILFFSFSTSVLLKTPYYFLLSFSLTGFYFVFLSTAFHLSSIVYLCFYFLLALSKYTMFRVITGLSDRPIYTSYLRNSKREWHLCFSLYPFYPLTSGQVCAVSILLLTQ